MRAVVVVLGLVSLTACVGGGASPEQSSSAAGHAGGVGSGTSDASAAEGGNGGRDVDAAAGGDSAGASAAGSGGSGGRHSSTTGSAGVGGASGAGGSVGQGQAGAAANSGMPSTGAPDSHFPLVAGARWTYHHSGGSKAAWDETDTMTAGTYKDMPAFVFEDQEDAQGAQTHSTLVVQGTGVYRAYKEVTVGGQTALTVSYDPAFLRYDEGWLAAEQQVSLDDVWVQTCVFSSVAKTCGAGAVRNGSTTHTFTVLSVSSKVTVPAGTFDAVKIQRVDPNTAETKLYWFAKGVGKVRDETPATGAITELASFSIP